MENPAVSYEMTDANGTVVRRVDVPPGPPTEKVTLSSVVGGGVCAALDPHGNLIWVPVNEVDHG